jgi:hypothetical protein
MIWLKLRRPSPALVISLIALFVALGGTGYAALKLPKNSVGSKQLKKNAVTSSKIKAGAITGAKVKNGSLTGADIQLGALGTVPSATNAANATNAGHASSADNATHAGNADTVGGETIVRFSKLVATNTATPQDVLKLGGLTLQLACDAAGEPTLTANGAVAGSMIRGMRITSGNGAAQGGSSNITGPGQTVTIIAAADNRGGVMEQYAQPDGHVVSVSLYVDDSSTINGFDGCSASGSAIAG